MEEGLTQSEKKKAKRRSRGWFMSVTLALRMSRQEDQV